MDIRRTRTCEKCKQVVALDKVRLYPLDENKNQVLCETCCEALKNIQKLKQGKNVKPLAPRQVIKNKVVERKNISESLQLPPGALKVFCERCRYYFKTDLNKAGVSQKVSCPYCGLSDRLYPPEEELI